MLPFDRHTIGDIRNVFQAMNVKGETDVSEYGIKVGKAIYSFELCNLR